MQNKKNTFKARFHSDRLEARREERKPNRYEFAQEMKIEDDEEIFIRKAAI